VNKKILKQTSSQHMAATKGKKGEKGGPGGAHSHIRARIDYLHKAAIYLQTQTQTSRKETHAITDDNIQKANGAIHACVPRHYINQMRGISTKTQQRLSIETKRSYCKRCDLLLVPGATSTEEVENESKDRKKPWADVLVVKCKACETVKRFPQNHKRSAKLAARRKERDGKEEFKEESGAS
jgi:ribonuclease P protein subunit RPR2